MEALKLPFVMCLGLIGMVSIEGKLNKNLGKNLPFL